MAPLGSTRTLAIGSPARKAALIARTRSGAVNRAGRRIATNPGAWNNAVGHRERHHCAVLRQRPGAESLPLCRYSSPHPPYHQHDRTDDLLCIDRYFSIERLGCDEIDFSGLAVRGHTDKDPRGSMGGNEVARIVRL